MSKIRDYIKRRNEEGASTFILRGGRRSGKTYGILIYLLLYCVTHPKTVVNVASMTSEQGRLGAYADAVNIIGMMPQTFAGVEVLSSPREVRFANGSRMHFNSYAVSERAKGIACDYLFMNEANNFTQQQYTDLVANVRKGTFLDFNPNVLFWVNDIFDDADICDTTWKDNPYLTKAQLEYFDNLKRMAERPDATDLDRRNYSVYYLGEYAEISGTIFTAGNIKFVDALPRGLRHFAVFCDPSALRGADWFACVLSASDAEGNVYIADTFSVNTGSRELVARKILDWCKSYDVGERVYVETNGIIGIDFYDFCANSGIPVQGWYSKGNKFERIVANYQNFVDCIRFVESEANRKYVQQIYDFAKNCEHDDNVDAVNSSYNLQRWIA